jgi:O-methyltransferase
MRSDDFAELLADVQQELLAGVQNVGILGLTTTALDLISSLTRSGLLATVEAVYGEELSPRGGPQLPVPLRSFAELAQRHHEVLVVAADEEKEDILLAALPYIQGAPKVVVAGYGHLRFRNPLFHKELAQLLVPSLANGYPNTLTHLYQCLVNSARLKLQGIVAEFGMFKGGTTMFLARIIEQLGQNWPVIGFDTFGGFPARRSPLDMYDHPDCIFTDLPTVRRYLDGRNIKIVPGDIVETIEQLKGKDVILSFIDTDNYTSARAALEVVQERTIVGGAIVFDHFTGVNRFRYTLGERIAGRILLDDYRYFHLHGTGVFFRQQ